MGTSNTTQFLPSVGTFLIGGVAARYQLLFGDEFTDQPGFYRFKNGGGHVLKLEGGPAAALNLVEAARAEILAMAATRDVAVNRGRSFSNVPGHYLLLDVVTDKRVRPAIIFITEDGHVHQHYQSNPLEGDQLLEAYDQLGINFFAKGMTNFLEFFREKLSPVPAFKTAA